MVHTPDLDVADVLDDPDFRDDTLMVKRGIVLQAPNGTADESAGFKPFSGTPYPAGGHDLVQRPEGDYVSGDLVIVTRFPLSAGGGENEADIVECKGGRYRVVNAKPWPYGQGFTQATCMLMPMNPSTMIEGYACGPFG